MLHKVLLFAFLNCIMLPHELMASQSASSSASNAIVDKGLKYLEQGKRDEAKQCFQKAAEQDYVMAQSKLGCLLADEGNFTEAKVWFQKAAEQGYVPEKPKSSRSIPSKIGECVLGIITDLYNKLKR